MACCLNYTASVIVGIRCKLSYNAIRMPKTTECYTDANNVSWLEIVREYPLKCMCHTMSWIIHDDRTCYTEVEYRIFTTIKRKKTMPPSNHVFYTFTGRQPFPWPWLSPQRGYCCDSGFIVWLLAILGYVCWVIWLMPQSQPGKQENCWWSAFPFSTLERIVSILIIRGRVWIKVSAFPIPALSAMLPAVVCGT